MKVCNYARSFVTFRIDMTKQRPITVSQEPPFTVNNARLQVDSRCRIIPGAGGGKPREFVLTASCKGEQVNVPRGMWHEPSADMCMIAGEDEFMVLKSWDRHKKGVMLHPPSLGEQPERQVCRVAEALDSLTIRLVLVTGRPLRSTDQIIDSVMSGRVLVGQTEFEMQDGSRVVVEYPIKTINVSEQDHYYQIDAGPILLPELDRKQGRNFIGGLQRAFIAHNAPDYAEVIVNVPTPLTRSISVHHYSKVKGLRVSNRLIELP